MSTEQMIVNLTKKLKQLESMVIVLENTVRELSTFHRMSDDVCVCKCKSRE